VLGYGGQAGGAPALPGVQVADIGGGSLFAVVGILAALHEARTSGQGRFVDVSLTDGATAFLHMHLASRLQLGAEGGPLQRGAEPLNGGYPCYGVYRTRDDRYLAVGALEPKFFKGVCEVVGRPELLEDAYALGEPANRVRRELEAIFLTRTRAEWVAAFEKKDLCVEPVLEGDEVLNDPQLRAHGLFAEEGGVVWLRTPLRMGERGITPPPGLGEHTDEIRRECGVK
jgi:crotonobetainyl-CoA:carnitine CoA-transferase CaiB-like acyl-CoA transferase